MTVLPLFPLQTVLFPGGRLNLKVFEARYLDMVGDCLRQQRPFGVVCLQAGGEVHRKDKDGPGAASRGTRLAFVLSMPARAGTEPRHLFPSGERLRYSAVEGPT